MMRNGWPVSLTFVLFVSGCASPQEPVQPSESVPPAGPSVEDDQAAIGETIRMLEQTWNAGDMVANSGYVDDEMIQLPPNAAARVGKADAQAGWEEDLAENDSEWHPTVQNIWVSGDLGVARGRFTDTMTPKDGGEATVEDAKTVWVFRRGDDGQWRLLLEAWNSDGPPN